MFFKLLRAMISSFQICRVGGTSPSASTPDGGYYRSNTAYEATTWIPPLNS